MLCWIIWVCPGEVGWLSAHPAPHGQLHTLVMVMPVFSSVMCLQQLSLLMCMCIRENVSPRMTNSVDSTTQWFKSCLCLLRPVGCRASGSEWITGKLWGPHWFQMCGPQPSPSSKPRAENTRPWDVKGLQNHFVWPCHPLGVSELNVGPNRAG